MQHLTVHVALDDQSPENGAITYIPGWFGPFEPDAIPNLGSVPGKAGRLDKRSWFRGRPMLDFDLVHQRCTATSSPHVHLSVRFGFLLADHYHARLPPLAS